MKFSPTVENFAELYNAGRAQVVWTELVADVETPVAAMLKVAGNEPDSFLLESVEGGISRGRYSFIGLRPDLVWRCRGNRAQVNRSALTHADQFEECPISADQGAIASLRALVRESMLDLPPSLPPMASGLVGYLSYDIVRLIERLPAAKPDVFNVPDALFLRPTIVCIFDNLEDKITLVTPVRRNESSASVALELAQSRLYNVAEVLQQPVVYPRPDTPATKNPAIQSNVPREYYLDIVRRAKEYILAGDIFQVVLSQRFSLPFNKDGFALYRGLRRLNPSPFLFFLRFRDFSLIGSSPEIMVRVRAGKVVIRPIAGTRHRGTTFLEDETLAQDLRSDPKECAEHLMLLDLGRNDVGRVAAPASVQVTERMAIERYSHVMHLVSNVEGDLAAEFDAIDALFAGFPAGTVTGAPKVRAMEIIDELEADRRGVYGGCIGYIGANGEIDTCIALRTAFLKDKVLYVQAGGGIVADSVPEMEHQECLNKAGALLQAADEAHRFE